VVSPSRTIPRGFGSAIALVALVILIGLGVWQVQRLQWKEALLTHIKALQAAPARSLAQVLGGTDDDMVRVGFDCPDLMSRPRLRLYGVQDGQVGYRLIAACPAGKLGASVLVDLGFESQALSAPTDPACLKPVDSAPLTGPVVGVLRRPDKPSFVTPPNQPDQNLWYWRDLPAMAKALGMGVPAASFVALEKAPGAVAGACPLTPSAPPKDIPNNHLQYAITWFGLALALVGVYVAMLFRKRPD
jgi:surfeit locus 1 family protein